MKNLYMLSIFVLCMGIIGCKSTDTVATVENAASYDNHDSQNFPNDGAHKHNNTPYVFDEDDSGNGISSLPICEQWPAELCQLSPEMVTFIVVENAVNDGNSYEQVPLMLAMDPTSVRILIASGADVNARDQDEMTPIMYASHPEAIKTLAQNGADVNAVDNEGRTALFYVESVEAAKALLSVGANPKIRDKYGKTCLDLDENDLSVYSSNASEYVRQAMEK